MAAKLGAETKPKKPRQAPKPAVPKADPGMTSAAGAGHNSQALREERERIVYRAVDIERTAKAKIEELMLPVKAQKTLIANARETVKRAGIPLKILDEAVEKANQTRGDQRGYEATRVEVFSMFNLVTTADVQRLFDGNEAAEEGMDWEATGFTARLVGSPAKPPVTGSDGQLWLQGWHAADKKTGGGLAQAAADAIQADESGKTAPGVAAGIVGNSDHATELKTDCKFDWGTVGAGGQVIVLNREAFELEEGEGLDEASKVSVKEDVIPYWDAAERVLAFWDGKRRVLKEPGYEDIGGTEVDISPVEDVADPLAPPDELAQAEHLDTGGSDLGADLIEAIAEVEPELVAQVLEDHGDNDDGPAFD